MPPQINSPTRPSRPKRESLTISRSVGKALADVMNKDKSSTTALSSTESERAGNTGSPARTRATGAKPVITTTREGSRGARPSLDISRGTGGTDKSTPKLTKRAPTSSKPTSRPQAVVVPSSSGDDPSKKPEKPSKSRTSLTFRGLSSALQPKPGLPPSALPKYRPKSATEMLVVPRSDTRKRHSDWDVEKAEEKDEGNGDVKSSDDDADDEFVTVERPISPLPRRAMRKTILPVSLSSTPSTPKKGGNILHKASASLSSATSPSAFKTAKTPATTSSPVARLQAGHPRPPSVASVSSQRATPVQSPRKATSIRAKLTASAKPVNRLPVLPDSPQTGGRTLESSPGNPFQLPETSSNSLLSPPLSPFLDGVSIDSIDAGDVSALLSTVLSPTKPTFTSDHTNRDIPSQTRSHDLHVFPEGPNLAPHTPTSSRSISSIATDPRQSMISLRQFLENSGDLEHLLSQPLPSILTPDARERLLSFGFSPGLPPPPFPSAMLRPEPQTPCPVSDGHRPTSISQVLFPSVPSKPSTQQQHNVLDLALNSSDSQTRTVSDGGLVEILKRKLEAAEGKRAERDARIESLEKQLISLGEAREREAAELSTQVSNLEVRVQELLDDHERDSERRTSEIEERLRDKDVECDHRVVAAVAELQAQYQANQERLVSVEQRKGSMRSAAVAWKSVRDIACSELELVRYNRRFVEVTLAGLDASMGQLRLIS